MPLPDHPDRFYLGRKVDPSTGQPASDPYLFDPADLTTHAVVVGMTGSGKTGLCLDLMEEAALSGVPAILIDPKGDITNLLLQFPDLAPAEFSPWIDPDAARREGKSLEQVAFETAEAWKSGLAAWGLGPEDIRRLRESVQFAVYTPGSEAGLPVSILSSFAAPELSWAEHQEDLREKIAATVTALLGLVGLSDIDPLTSREHILLSNLLEHAWSQGRGLDLAELILQAQSPPFDKLGVFGLEQFFPQKERFVLAMRLNSLLAAPGFQAWVKGDPLDIARLLRTPEGRPRHSIFYLAHLSDAERMFIVTLLFSAVETWMRAQSGSTGLRALVYFDEIFGYLPAVAEPPSKAPILRMLKQARAFGVGLLLATQNPVDLDYKALSNAGTWFVGKLQTDQDKQRLLDGLEGAAGVAGFDRGEADRLISSLSQRTFLVKNVHTPGLAVMLSRWAMSYLAGPLTRPQLGRLNALAGAVAPPPTTRAPLATVTAAPMPTPITSPAPSASQARAAGSQTRPAVPSGLAEYFLPNNLTLSESLTMSGKPTTATEAPHALGLIYRPGLFAQAIVRFLDRKNNVDVDRRFAAFVADPDPRGAVRWENFPFEPVEAAALPTAPEAGAAFGELDPLLAEVKRTAPLEKDFADFVYRTASVTVLSNPTLKLVAPPGTSPAQFRQQCADAARERRDQDSEKLTVAYRKKLETLRTRLSKEEREMAEDEAELRSRKMEELARHGETLLDLFGGRRARTGISASLTKRRMTKQAKADVEESAQSIEDYRERLADLEAEMEVALAEVQERWAGAVDDVQEIKITPLKKDIAVDLFGVAWRPFWLAQAGGTTVEIPAYGPTMTPES